MDFINEAVAYVQAHPRLAAFLALTFVLACVGLWYVIRHHLQMIVVTILCGLGILSGGLVIYRAWTDQVLVGIGIFLMLVFPIIWLRGISSLRAPDKPKPVAAAALYDIEIKPKQGGSPAPRT